MDNISKILSANSKDAEIKFLFNHLLSDDITLEEQIRILEIINHNGINKRYLSLMAAVVLERSSKLNIESTDFIDTCGTGGSKKNIFNCSTLSAFVVASCGLKVLKHGNKASTGKAGSADFLERAGVNLNANQEVLKKAYEALGIAFLFAPLFHSSLRFVANARKAIKEKTIFNVLGPLVHPAAPQYQVVGSSDIDICRDMIEILLEKKVSRAMVVCAFDSIDEITVTGPSQIYELKNKKITEWVFEPKDYGFSTSVLEEIQTNSIEEAHLFGLEVLNGKRGAGLDMVAINAGAALYIGAKVKSLSEGIEHAKREILSGRALLKLNTYAQYTKS